MLYQHLSVDLEPVNQLLWSRDVSRSFQGSLTVRRHPLQHLYHVWPHGSRIKILDSLILVLSPNIGQYITTA